MKVLVTGGSGFIGSNLSRLLLEAGHQVTVLDTRWGDADEPTGLMGVKGDVRDEDLLGRVVPGHDAIVHLAAQTGVPASLDSPLTDCDVNVVGTVRLLEAARNAGVNRFVFASSNALLGRQTPPAEETKVPLPISPYGASKLAGEAYCLAYHGSWGLRTVALRFSNAYGPFSLHKNSVVAKYFRAAASDSPLTIEGDGSQTRDFVYVKDLCASIALAVEKDIGGEIFQIATGVETAIRDLAAMVNEVCGKDIKIEYSLPRRGDIARNYSAFTKARRLLGWEPETTLRDGLRLTWEWMHNHDGPRP